MGIRLNNVEAPVKATFWFSFILCVLQGPLSALADVNRERALEIAQTIEVEFTAEVKKAAGADLRIQLGSDDSLTGRNLLSTIFFGGGFLNQPEIDEDVLTLIICHEVGHTLGGAPFLGHRSIEGQSDYYATSKCLPRLWSQQDNEIIWEQTEEQDIAENKCYAAHSDRSRAQLCVRSLRAAHKLGQYFARSQGKEPVPSLTTADSFVQERGFYYTDYPSNQCRVDTMVSGGLCVLDLYAPVDIYRAKNSGCSSGVGARPLCWHQPKLDR